MIIMLYRFMDLKLQKMQQLVHENFKKLYSNSIR